MKTYSLALLAIVAVTSLGIFLVAHRSIPAAPTPVLATAQPNFTPPAVPRVPPPEPRPEAEPAKTETIPPKPLEPTADAATARIRLLAASFDETQVPELAAYLGHPSIEVRQEALNGLVLLGFPSSSHHLRAAAQVATQAGRDTEAQALEDAASLVAALPPQTRIAPRDLAELEHAARLPKPEPGSGAPGSAAPEPENSEETTPPTAP